MGAALQLLEWEARQIFLDRGFMAKVAIGMAVSLLLLPFLLNSLSSFSESVNAPNLPFVFKIVSIAVVGENAEIRENLEGNTLVSVVATDPSNAEILLRDGNVNGILYLSGTSARFLGNGNALSSLAELQVREAVDKAFRPERGSAVKAIQKESIEPFVRGIIAPFIIFSPLLMWCLPIIQSISYDRENKMLEALFSLPIERRWIYISKVLANFTFAFIAGLAWMLILGAFGLQFQDFGGSLLVLSLISLLIISLNGLVSTISTNVKNATLAAGIVSTITFSFLFILSLLRINPYLSAFSALSPVTYISYQVSLTAAPLPFNTLAVFLILIITANVLSIAAFSTEKFAFSLNPGIAQLYEGMAEMLSNPHWAAAAMGFVAFSLTLPVQILALGVMLFVSSSYWAVILFLAGIEEALKFIALKIIRPAGVKVGAKYGALVGAAYGICESVLYAPFLPLAWLRAVPIFAHALFSSVAGAGVGARRQYWGLAAAVLLHFLYNFLILRNYL